MAFIGAQSFKLRNMHEALGLAETLAASFPDPDHVTLGIYELLLNAIEHGNLGIGFEEKEALLRTGKWQEEIERRQSLPQYSSKVVTIDLSANEQSCSLTIADQGCGFLWQKYLGHPANYRRPNGRGLWIAFNSKFDSVDFNETGNQVTCVSLQAGKRNSAPQSFNSTDTLPHQACPQP